MNGNKSEVARVNVNYKDELADGSEQSASGVARIDFTDSQSAADKSVNGEVVAQKELILTAVAKDRAMAQADAGNYKQAAETLAAQNASLNRAFAAAPAEVQIQIRQETNYLSDFSGQLEGGSYNGASRKAMSAQSYNTRNSK